MDITTDGSQSDVQAKINAAQPGDRVIIPGGSHSWTAGMTSNKKNITIMGADPNTRPLITLGAAFVIIGNGPTGTTVVRDLKFRASANIDGILQLRGNAGQIRNYRLTNCEVMNNGGGSRDIYADAYGLIDHCTFPDSGQTASIYCRNSAIGWAGTMSFGTEENVVIEDCTWVNDDPDPGTVVQRQCIDGIDAFRAIVRHCNFTNCQIETHGCTSNVNGGCNNGTPGREGLQMEAHDNVFLFKGSSEDAADTFGWICRGGTGVFYNNTIQFSGAFWKGSPMIRFRSEYTHAYPAPNQPGQGLTSLNTIGRVPIYCWNNTIDGVAVTSDTSPCNWGGCHNFVSQEGSTVENVDFFVNTEKPGYTALQYPHPLQTIEITGTITHVVTGRPIPGVTVSSPAGATATTDALGRYSISVPTGVDVTIAPSKAQLAPATPGVTTVDVIAVNRHFLELAALTGNDLAAADVVGTAAIDTFDETAIQRFAVGNTTTSHGRVGSHVFTPGNASFVAPTTNKTQNFTAIVLGDVSSPRAYDVVAGREASDTIPDTWVDAGDESDDFDVVVSTDEVSADSDFIGFEMDFVIGRPNAEFEAGYVAAEGLTASGWTLSAELITAIGSSGTSLLRVSGYSTDGQTPLEGTGSLFRIRPRKSLSGLIRRKSVVFITSELSVHGTLIDYVNVPLTNRNLNTFFGGIHAAAVREYFSSHAEAGSFIDDAERLQVALTVRNRDTFFGGASSASIVANFAS